MSASASPGERAAGLDNPAYERQRADPHDDHVEPAERYRQAAGIFAHQPIAGEAWNDASADQRDQQHDNRDPDPDAGFRGAMEMRLEMECDIACQQQQNQHHHIEVSPIAPGQDLACRSGRDQRQEAGIDQHRSQPARFGGKRHSDASCDPDDHERQQGHTSHRQTPGPVRDRREQESRDHRRQVTVEHFMHMPVARRKCGYHRQFAVKHRQPNQHSESRHRSSQAERTGESRSPATASPDRCGGARTPS